MVERSRLSSPSPLRRFEMSRWRYDREFMVELPRVSGKIRVAFETLAPYDDDDPLHGLFAWIRLVIWTNREGKQMPHVNAASELEKLFRARLQAFPDPQTGGVACPELHPQRWWEVEC